MHVRGTQAGDGPGQDKAVYAFASAHHHPYRDTQGKAPVHRMVAEASANRLDYDTFLTKVRAGDTEGLTFLDTTAWAVHHVDLDHRNNDPGNLEVMTHREHHQLHAALGTTSNVLFKVVTEGVIAIEPFGEEITYDISVVGEPHNFLADGFVVHNTGMSGMTTTRSMRSRPPGSTHRPWCGSRTSTC